MQQAEASVVSQKSPGVGSNPTAVTLSSCVTNQLMEPGFSITAGRARLNIGHAKSKPPVGGLAHDLPLTERVL